MIIIDTLSHFTQCHLDKTRGLMLFTTEDNAYFKTNSKEYSISNSLQTFTPIKERIKKYSAYKTEFRNLPFTETEFFFGDLSKKINNQSIVFESDSTYTLEISDLLISFRKTDFSIKSITELVYDRIHKGFQFNQYLFGIVNDLDRVGKETINYAHSIIDDPSKNSDNFKKESKPKSIEKSILEKSLVGVVNGRIESLKNKIVFLDFFYQGCLPCVKSYPFVNLLFKSADSNLIVIGVDQLKSDSSTIDKYIKKYNLLYPILIGQPAVSLRQYFELHSFPTFIVLNEDGKIIDYGDGFTKSSFKRLTKRIL
jgi:thiol-disulfide isomerase/thioredoxin